MPSWISVFSVNSPVSVSTMATVCCFACRSHPGIFNSASFVPSLFGWYHKVYWGRSEAAFVMSSVTNEYLINPNRIVSDRADDIAGHPSVFGGSRFGANPFSVRFPFR